MKKVTVTKIQNNFNKYLKYVIDGKEIIITKNDKEIARLIPTKKPVRFITDSLVGILKNNYDDKLLKETRIRNKNLIST